MVFELILIGSLLGFTAWLSHLSHKISRASDLITNGDDQLDEIRESVEIVAQILAKLPEMMPQFALQNSPTDFLKPMIEAFASNLMGTQPLNAHDGFTRNQDGQFNATTPKEITEENP